LLNIEDSWLSGARLSTLWINHGAFGLFNPFYCIIALELIVVQSYLHQNYIFLYILQLRICSCIVLEDVYKQLIALMIKKKL
jgi:hypothetical protein